MRTVSERELILVNRAPMIGCEVVDFMLKKGFCSAPASTKYHGAYEGGLFDHCEAMEKALIDMNLRWTRANSPYKIAWLHDLCKIDKYTKVWDKPPVLPMVIPEDKGEFHYSYNENDLIGGHATKSLILSLQYEELTQEEIMCILYHMGAYETKDWDLYDKAIRQYPNVLWTHTADMVASKIMGV